MFKRRVIRRLRGKTERGAVPTFEPSYEEGSSAQSKVCLSESESKSSLFRLRVEHFQTPLAFTYDLFNCLVLELGTSTHFRGGIFTLTLNLVRVALSPVNTGFSIRHRPVRVGVGS